MCTQFDEKMMLLALELGEKSRVIAPPNPWVGCVFTLDGAIIGQGSTQKVGEAHAEVVALKQAGAKARGATAYITLEPCSHYGRTPPCSQALIEAGVAKVIIALKDPDDRVNGKGIRQLQDAGIKVISGVCQAEAEASLAPYLFQRKNKRPFVVAKSACSIDGRIAAQDGSSQWISSEQARKDALFLRAASQAILVGSKTAQYDLPRLTARGFERTPLRVVLDSKGRLEAKGPLFDTSFAPTLIFTTHDTPPSKIQEWQSAGVSVEILPKTSLGTVDLRLALKSLGEKDVLQLLCEGGGELLGALFQEKLVNRFVLFMGPCILGDKGKPLLSRFDVPALKDAPKLNFVSSKELEGTIRLDYSI